MATGGKKYLDDSGLAHLWGKMTDYVGETVSSAPASSVDWSNISNKPDVALKSDLVSVYTYKGSVAAYAALPTSGSSIGDVWNVEDTGMNYAWTGTGWDSLGQVFEVRAITNAEIDAIIAG